MLNGWLISNTEYNDHNIEWHLYPLKLVQNFLFGGIVINKCPTPIASMIVENRRLFDC